MKSRKLLLYMTLPGVLTVLPGCQGLFEGIYDEPLTRGEASAPGRLYLDASDWLEWHYIDLHRLEEAVSSDPGFDVSSLWTTRRVETVQSGDNGRDGIYTYWYDVFGAGLSNREFRGFMSTVAQSEPDEWTIAVHRDNVRTNGCSACATDYYSFDSLPEDCGWLESLEFVPDEWNETDVWVIRDRMLLGIVGSQGIEINPVLSSWLTVEIPPMPPVFRQNSRVYVLKLEDGSYAALQLEDHIGAEGEKCCLTINCKYPL